MPQLPMGQLMGHKGGQLLVIQTSTHLTPVEIIGAKSAVPLQVIVDIQTQATAASHYPGRRTTHMEGVNHIDSAGKIEIVQYRFQAIINIGTIHFATLAQTGHSKQSNKCQYQYGQTHQTQPNE